MAKNMWKLREKMKKSLSINESQSQTSSSAAQADSDTTGTMFKKEFFQTPTVDEEKEIARILKCKNFFEVLEVDPESDLDKRESDVRESYLDKCLLLQPNQCGHPKLNDAYQRLIEAYDTLSSPDLRDEHRRKFYGLNAEEREAQRAQDQLANIFGRGMFGIPMLPLPIGPSGGMITNLGNGGAQRVIVSNGPGGSSVITVFGGGGGLPFGGGMNSRPSQSRPPLRMITDAPAEEGNEESPSRAMTLTDDEDDDEPFMPISGLDELFGSSNGRANLNTTANENPMSLMGNIFRHTRAQSSRGRNQERGQTSDQNVSRRRNQRQNRQRRNGNENSADSSSGSSNNAASRRQGEESNPTGNTRSVTSDIHRTQHLSFDRVTSSGAADPQSGPASGPFSSSSVPFGNMNDFGGLFQLMQRMMSQEYDEGNNENSQRPPRQQDQNEQAVVSVPRPPRRRERSDRRQRRAPPPANAGQRSRPSAGNAHPNFETQLSALNDMGFTNRERNVRALEFFNGNVEDVVAFFVSQD